ncbi:hypothetical protein BGX29_011527 [Mortierella sp. GBA35]|nr:hypothetical protein BGX29_011527 [Mortierella sp. GBA35]
MFMKALASFAILASPLLVSAYEPVTCAKNATQNIVTSITSADAFCTMMTGYGVTPVAPNEGCASVYCHGPASKLGPPMPKGYILSANYAVSPNNTYVQVTGCIDSSVWGQNPTDEGGQMDSHGWPYSCQGWKKFVSLIEPATNTFCIRCCSEDNNVDCNTSISTKGCWNVVPGLYQMADGSVCAPPQGSNTTAVPTIASPTASGTASILPTSSSGSGSSAVNPVTTGTGSASNGNSGGSSSTGTVGGVKPSVVTGNSAIRSLASSPVEILGALGAVAVAFAVSF